MAYYILTHGWGVNPDKHITIEYKDYKAARAALDYLFDAYQHQIETAPYPETFVCILKTRGILDNGKKDDETKEATRKGHKKS